MQTRRTFLASGAALLLSGRARAADGYADALAKAYGASVDPAPALRLALREARKVAGQADRLLRRQGLTRGTVAERLRVLAADDRWLYPDGDAGRATAVADMNARLAALRPGLAAAFGDRPMPEAVVRRPALKDEARGGYREPPAYFVDLRTIRERPNWTLPSVAFHETVPGHALIASVTGKPPAFSEAWPIYAEQLAADLGAYAGDPLGEIGFLHWRLFRLARIVADTGLGALGWSADQATTAMADLQGPAIAFTTLAADVARMGTQPGVYAAQGLGALAIGRARPRRQTDWPAFHRAILADGATPFAMLAQVARPIGAGETGR